MKEVIAAQTVKAQTVKETLVALSRATEKTPLSTLAFKLGNLSVEAGEEGWPNTSKRVHVGNPAIAVARFAIEQLTPRKYGKSQLVNTRRDVELLADVINAYLLISSNAFGVSIVSDKACCHRDWKL